MNLYISTEIWMKSNLICIAALWNFEYLNTWYLRAQAIILWTREGEEKNYEEMGNSIYSLIPVKEKRNNLLNTYVCTHTHTQTRKVFVHTIYGARAWSPSDFQRQTRSRIACIFEGRPSSQLLSMHHLFSKAHENYTGRARIEANILIIQILNQFKGWRKKDSLKMFE